MANKKKLKAKLSAKSVSKKTPKRGPKKVVSAQKRAAELELQSIEQLLGEDFDSLAQARAAMKRETEAIELQSIEQLLGEDFDSLAQARAAMKRETEAATKRAIDSIKKRKPPTTEAEKEKRRIIGGGSVPQKSYTIRELNKKQKQSVKSFLGDRQRAKEIDKELLNKGEYWGAEITYRYKDKDGKIKEGTAKTYNIFQGIAGLFAKLSEYAQRSGKQGMSGNKQSRWLNSIRIVKFGSGISDPGKEWGRIKQDEIKQRKKKG